jgi:hypothetical protein
MPQFVLLYHDWPAGPRGSHCDLMFEVGDSLRTWSLSLLPAAWRDIAYAAVSTGNEVQAAQLPDHRLTYLEYEGPVSGERGSVRRLDRGQCSVSCDNGQRFEVELCGVTICGTVQLERIGSQWLLSLR